MLSLFISHICAAPVDPDVIDLKDPIFYASGDGDITTSGSIDEGDRALSVVSRRSWQEGHGIRVRRAGVDTVLHTADAGWRLPPDAFNGTEVSHPRDDKDKKEGEASVRCRFTGTPPDRDSDGLPDPVDLCEVDLGNPVSFDFDELRLWIRSSVDVSSETLQIRVLTEERLLRFQLELPELEAGMWKEVHVELKNRTGLLAKSGAPRFVSLRCTTQCDGLVVHMDQLLLVQDLIAKVVEVAPPRGAGARWTLTLDRAAGRSVVDEAVYHDDTEAVKNWLQSAQPAGAALFAPAGIYYISKMIPLYSNTHIRCQRPDTTIFKNTGRSRNGPPTMFMTQMPRPENILVENCGFDWHGWNVRDFATVLHIRGREGQLAHNIEVQGNVFFDSALPGMEGCDQDQDVCVTRQRHHILVLAVNGAWIEHNQLSGGGRIKAAGPGRDVYIRHNTLDFINDNGITIVDTRRDCTMTLTCHTERIEISDNTILNAIGGGIFFGVDGETQDDRALTLEDVTIARNHIEGFFHNGIVGILPGGGASNVHITDNVVRSVRDQALAEGFTNGLMLSRGNAATNPVTDVMIDGNIIFASGTHASLPNGGMLLRGIRTLRIMNNEVRCDRCGKIEMGIWLFSGAFEYIELVGNYVEGTQTALLIGHGFSTPQLTITNMDIEVNEFLNSTSETAGQMTITLAQGETVTGQITQNLIHGGAGFGILCKGNGTTNLNIIDNSFIANAKGEIVSCGGNMR